MCKAVISKGRRGSLTVDIFSKKGNVSVDGRVEEILCEMNFFVEEKILSEEEYFDIVDKLILYFLAHQKGRER